MTYEEILFRIGFFGWPFIIAATIALNWYRITIRKLKPHYLSANYSRAFFGLICLLCMSARDGFNGIDFAYPRTLIPYIPHGVYIATSFYLFFDPGLNIARGKDVDYQGKDSGILDSMKKGIYYTIKGLCAVGLVWSIVMIWRD